MIFTTNVKEFAITLMHARIPLTTMLKNTWLNFSLDIVEFFNYCFKGESNCVIDKIVLSGNCRIRKVFSTRGPIMDTMNDREDEFEIAPEILPKSVAYPIGVEFINQLYTPNKIKSEIIKFEHPVKRVSNPILGVTPDKHQKYIDNIKKSFNRTANQDFEKQLKTTIESIRTNISTYNSTQESLLKRTSYSKDVKMETYGYPLKTPEVNSELERRRRGITERKEIGITKGLPPHPKPSYTNKQNLKPPIQNLLLTQKDPINIINENRKKQLKDFRNRLSKEKPSSIYNRTSDRFKNNTKEETKNTPSVMLRQTIGANQLNTFTVPDFQNSYDEIEEDIEGDDKQSTASIKEDDLRNGITPLYSLNIFIVD